MAVNINDSKNKNKYPHIKLFDKTGISKHSHQRRKKNRSTEDILSILLRLRSQTPDVDSRDLNGFQTTHEVTHFLRMFSQFPVYFKRNMFIGALLETSEELDELKHKCKPSNLRLDTALLSHEHFLVIGNASGYTIYTSSHETKTVFSRLETKILLEPLYIDSKELFYSGRQQEDSISLRKPSRSSTKPLQTKVSTQKSEGLFAASSLEEISFTACPVENPDYTLHRYAQATDDDEHASLAFSNGYTTEFQRGPIASTMTSVVDRRENSLEHATLYEQYEQVMFYFTPCLYF